jgi:hypothetical protein
MSITIKTEISDDGIAAIRELATLNPKKHPRNSIYVKNNEPRLDLMRELAKLSLVDIRVSHSEGREYVMEVVLGPAGYRAFDLIEKELKDEQPTPKVEPENYAQSYMAWAEGFAIFAKYEPDERFSVATEHDIVYAGRKTDAYSPEDLNRLDELGWGYDDHLECYYKHT